MRCRTSVSRSNGCRRDESVQERRPRMSALLSEGRALGRDVGAQLVDMRAQIVEPRVGVEPTTVGLQNRCSAIELPRRRAGSV